MNRSRFSQWMVDSGWRWRRRRFWLTAKWIAVMLARWLVEWFVIAFDLASDIWRWVCVGFGIVFGVGLAVSAWVWILNRLFHWGLI